jgi:hypothetical protein
MPSEWRQLPVALFRDTRFVALSPMAKATYHAIAAELPSFGMGRLIIGTLPPLVNCSPPQLDAALMELRAAGWLEDDGMVYRLRGTEAGKNWGSPKYQTYLRERLEGLPPSAIVDAFLVELRARLASVKKKPALALQSIPGQRLLPTARGLSAAPDTVSIQKEKEIERENYSHIREERARGGSSIPVPPSVFDGGRYFDLYQKAYGADSDWLTSDEAQRLEGLEANYGPDVVFARLREIVRHVARERALGNLERGLAKGPDSMELSA